MALDEDVEDYFDTNKLEEVFHGFLKLLKMKQRL